VRSDRQQQVEKAMTSKARRSILIAAGALIAVAAVIFSYRHMMAMPDNLDLARTKLSESGRYQVAIAPEAEPVEQNALHSWVVTLATPQGAAVEGATIAIEGGMPQHRHGLPTAPQATEYLGDGRYRIEGVKFSMSGWWELRFEIASPAGDDTVTFNLVL
jgi:hypothetical protein